MNTKPFRIFISLFLAIALVLQAPVSMAQAAAGALDTSFDGDGKVTTAIGSDHDFGSAVALQPDGKIVVAGRSVNGSNWDFSVARYNADGALDTTFDGDGKATTDLGGVHHYGSAVALQPGGKIVVEGYIDNVSNADFALVRYNADGSLDTTFDGDGKQTTAVGSGDDYSFAVALQPDGKIVVAGYSHNGSNDDFALVRYNADGSLDTSFDGDGKATTAIGSGNDYGNAVALQPDGKILVAGRSYNGSNDDFALVRYNTDGSLDTGFDADGKQTTAIGNDGDKGYAVALQPDGKVVVAGKSWNGSDWNFAVVRYNADGSLDTTFDTDGKQTTAVGSSHDTGQAVALQPDGKIVVAGYSHNGSNDDFALVRYNANGSLDTTFDGDGKATTVIGSGNDYGNAVALQPDGKIVVAGDSNNGSNYDFAVVRYDGGLTAGSSANVTASVSLTALEAILGLFAHNISFPTVVLLGADQLVDSADYAWQASDTSAAAAGWHVTLSATDFSDGGGGSIPVGGFTVAMQNSAISTVSGNTPPTSQVASSTGLSSGGVTLLSAAVGNGLGTYNFVPHFQLLVPGATTAGDYNTTVTATIISGP